MINKIIYIDTNVWLNFINDLDIDVNVYTDKKLRCSKVFITVNSPVTNQLIINIHTPLYHSLITKGYTNLWFT